MYSCRLPPFEDDLISNDDKDGLYIDQGSEADSLDKEFSSPNLDRIGGRLHWVAKRSASNVDPLHRQVIKRREIVACEDADLHLVWHDEVIYVKPIPPYLFNHRFWVTHLLPATGPAKASTQVKAELYDLDALSTPCRQALGFLRSYSYLIQHRSDWHLAKQAHLVPDNISFPDLRRFLCAFASQPDEVVAPRYHYGQMRLSRLNWAVRIAQPAWQSEGLWWSYHKSHWRTGQYVRRLVGPAVFAFAALSLPLSAMQVVLAARPATSQTFKDVSYIFSVAVICLIPGITAVLVLGVSYILLSQWLFAFKTLPQGPREEQP